MTVELQFSRQVYAGEAVDEAVKAFSKFAKFDLSETDDHWVISVEIGPELEAHSKRILGEFGNTALGLTVQRGGVSASA